MTPQGAGHHPSEKAIQGETSRLLVDRGAVAELRRHLSGQLLRQGDPGFDAARRVWNGSIDRYPAVVASCVGVADIIRTVEFARSNGLPLAVRGGGHSVAGFGTCQDGVVLDLSPMQSVQVDPDRRTARAQGGATWGVFDRETHKCGLATTGGQVSSTGIGGLTLGGGIGWLVRKYGLSCDNLLSVQLVTADGSCVTASPTENEDLLWGVRGGGGNFGVVTSFEYRLHPVDTVLAGVVLHPLSRARRVLQFFRDYAAEAPDEVSLFAVFWTPPHLALARTDNAAPMIGLGACYTGSLDQGEEVIRPLRAFGPPVVDQVRVMTYPTLQRLLDAGAPAGLQNYGTAAYIRELSDDVIEAMMHSALTMRSPLSQVYISPLQGAVSRVGEQETAFSHRDAPYLVNILPMWSDPQGSRGHIDWARHLWAQLQPFSAGGVYANFLGEDGQRQVRASYGRAKYLRLMGLKTKHDPANLFRLNQNLVSDVPSGSPAGS